MYRDYLGDKSREHSVSLCREKESPVGDSSPTGNESRGHSVSPHEEKESLVSVRDESYRQLVVDRRHREPVKTVHVPIT
ncbi:hypothetical protein B296_00044456 [Ensete ventricosum]|uniref:Uncharacterized protein n=1 Tax=Ensete ventricosum TaxID=4639 RepID=A0A426YH77_ENSVE|nr:hypothetical protein B296_00044456 [Ensete ventricosum]